MKKVARIDQLTDEQKGQLDGWADKWIEIGLRTGAADRESFEAAAEQCYKFAGLAWPGRVVWVSSPMVLAIAAPVASLLLQLHRQGSSDAEGAVRAAVSAAVSAAVAGAVDGPIAEAIQHATQNAITDAVGDVTRAATGRVTADGGVVDVRNAEAARRAVGEVIRKNWTNFIGGQFWVGGWYWGGAVTSFFREVCGLELTEDLWARGIAYEKTMQSACWWHPHKDFVMVCERPTMIHRELANPDRPRGWGSHRLHRETGPAVAWPDGWGVYSVHGVRVPSWIVEHPETISVETIEKEKNAEIRRLMIRRYGQWRYLSDANAEEVHSLPDNYYVRGLQGARLYRKARQDDTDMVMIAVRNSTPEPDGSVKDYFLRVDPAAYDGQASSDCHAAMASTFRNEDGSLYYKRPRDYAPSIES